MDISINVSTLPVVTKQTTVKTVSTKTTGGNKNVSQPSHQFKWDSSGKNAKCFVNRRTAPSNVGTVVNNNNKKQFTKTIVETPLNVVNQNETNDKLSKMCKQIANKYDKNCPFVPVKEHMGLIKSSNKNIRPASHQGKQQKTFPLFNRRSDVPKTNIDNVAKVVPSIEDVFSHTGKTFKEIDIHPHTIINLLRLNITTMTAIQEKSIPVILSGKNTFIRSQTGSGKTLAYAIPIVEALQSIQPHFTRKDGVQALVVLPTRELAFQTYELFMSLVEPFRWIVPSNLSGGENRSTEKARIRKGINILIGTPGRLLDHMNHTQNLKLNKIRCLVLDEADRLLDMGFEKDINSIIDLIKKARDCDYDPIALMKKKSIETDESREETAEPTSEMPLKNMESKKMQTILLSATLTSNVKDLASFTLQDYVYVDPLSTDGTCNLIPEIGRADVVVPTTVKQQYIVTDVKTKLVVLASLIVSRVKEEKCKMFVFMESRQMVDYHETLLKKCLLTRPTKENRKNNAVRIDMNESDSDSDDDEEEVLDIKIFKLHGSMGQKDRVDVFKAFKTAQRGILICTDVVARGVDVPHADYVVQYTAPMQTDVYIHRVGRTGRAGQSGKALIFLTEAELEYVTHLRAEKKFILFRVTQENVLKNLMPFMQHLSPSNPQMAAEALQQRFEKTVLNNKELRSAACFAYSSWSRFYSSYPSDLRPYFDIKKAHIGHYVTSFALRISPQEVNKVIRAELSTVEEKRLNKKLSNDPIEETVKPNPKPKKRSRAHDLMISEFDSGIGPVKKKNKTK